MCEFYAYFCIKFHKKQKSDTLGGHTVTVTMSMRHRIIMYEEWCPISRKSMSLSLLMRLSDATPTSKLLMFSYGVCPTPRNNQIVMYDEWCPI